MGSWRDNRTHIDIEGSPIFNSVFVNCDIISFAEHNSGLAASLSEFGDYTEAETLS